MNKLMVFAKSKKFDMLHLTHPQEDCVNLTMIIDGDFNSIRGLRYHEVEFVGEFYGKEKYMECLVEYTELN